VIRAAGHQWRWEIDRDTVRVGQLVEFEVTATDVNHGFAIYKDKTHMVAQAQAMPGGSPRPANTKCCASNTAGSHTTACAP
jgi:heme/copper-type cytochrome/quinol oxidase subunit 2